MTDIHYWFADAPPTSTLSFFLFFVHPIFRGPAYTFKMFGTCREYFRIYVAISQHASSPKRDTLERSKLRKYSSSTSLHPTVKIFLPLTSCNVMTDIHYWFAAAPQKSKIFSLFEWSSIIRGPACTFEMFETYRFKRKRFWLSL
ncbi:hypothetical protein CEXT_643021 [Caerostris extrusa]|uniref:Maturase K n=1 Tax=Caerostris extrusa TaxID=172846 RepID=A0AAV4XQ67_CAEEX|nr:hypothetical protein CEXT_643021 [Caerostris extrusa]